ncbi:hypothetical protein FRB91_009156 [Serendipita sp. 411]|nr:hypothetical protein FRB91_009156 [Serendipita sp. 411]
MSFVTRNEGLSFEKGPASPARSGRLSAPFTPISSPFRKVLSPRTSSLSSRPNSRRVSEDLLQELAKGMQLSIVKDPSTSEPSSNSSIIDGTNQERSATATPKRKIPSPNRPTPDSQPTTLRSSPLRRMPSIAGPKSRPLGPHRSISGLHNDSHPSGEDPTEESARQLEVPAVERSPSPSQPGTELSSSAPVEMASSSAEHDDAPTPSTISQSGSEGRTRSNPILVTDEPQSPESNSENSKSSPNKLESRRRKRDIMDEEETEEGGIGVNVNKRPRCNESLNDWKATLQAGVYDLQSLFEKNEELYWFDDINNIWMNHTDESNDVDGQQNRDNDDQSTIESASSLVSDWEERELPIGTVAVPFMTSELYSIACEKLRIYVTFVNSEDDTEAQEKACDDMAEAWRHWHRQSAKLISMGDLRQYGEALDAQGRQAIADALDVQSALLQTWIDESLAAEEKERRIKEREATSFPKKLTPEATLQSVDFSAYIDFGDDQEDAINTNEDEQYLQVYPTTILPPLLPPTIPTTAAIATTTQQIPNIVSQGSSSGANFSKTPVVLIKAKILEPWARDMLYCNDHLSLTQWTENRARALEQKREVLEDKKEWLLNELNGPPRGDLTAREKRIKPSTRAFNSLPEDQKPVLLHGQAEVEEFTAKEYDRDYVVVCRLSFCINDGAIKYETRPCGQVVTSHDILIRHVGEKHFKQKRTLSRRTPAVTIGDVDATTPDTPTVTASTSTDETVPTTASKNDEDTA